MPLPNLDDIRWTQLVEEGKALIPVHGPEWTDHNAHDPGITLLELFAWVAEMDIYQANRIPDSHKRKFLGLAGITPRPPRASETLIQAALTEYSSHAPVALPAGTEFAAPRAGSPALRFRTVEPLTVLAATLRAVQASDGSGLKDLTDHFLGGPGGSHKPAYGFGELPEVGAALYLGLEIGHSSAFDEVLQIHFRFANERSDGEERRRLREDMEDREALCRGLRTNPCESASEPVAGGGWRMPDHHSARTVWEYAAVTGTGVEWRALEAEDDTRSMTLDGRVRVRLPAGSTMQRLGCPEPHLHYIRCRLIRGAFDAPPLISEILLNTAEAEQAVPAVRKWAIAKGVMAQGPAPSVGDSAPVRMKLGVFGEIAELAFGSEAGPEAPEAAIVAYEPATITSDGHLVLDLVLLGASDGGPNQRFELPHRPVIVEGFELWSLESGAWRPWTRRPDLDSSGPDKSHYVLDAGEGAVRLGDGEFGRVPADGELLFARFRWTEAETGNLSQGRVSELADSLWNRMLIGDPAPIGSRLRGVTNPVATTGGAGAEPLASAIAGAIDLREARLRAVTLEDYEHLALRTPGVRLARAVARPNLFPGFGCWKAPGFVTVVVVPASGGAQPAPSAGLKRAIKAWLNRRRILGTRVEVIGPEYTRVRVRATVRAFPGQGRQRLADEIAGALDGFFSPLSGGPNKTGWPLGRDVYAAEVLHVIDGTPGVDHVVSLELIAGNCEPQCGNICLPANGLVAAGKHEIEVVS